MKCLAAAAVLAGAGILPATTAPAWGQTLPSPLFSTPPGADSSGRAATTAWVRQQGFLGASGDASTTTILAPGSTTPRTAAARAGTTFNILDYGAVADGTTDIGPALNAIAAKLGAGAGSNVITFPAGMYRLASAVTFAGTAPVLQGQGFTQGPGGVGSGTWIKIDATGFTPFTFSGTNARGAQVRDLAIYQVHPAPAAGWAPTPYDYVFRIQDALGEVAFDNVLFAGVNRGIYADNSGRLDIRNVQGQFYTAGVEIDDCYDIPRIERLHAWTFATAAASVVSWQEANSDTVILRRVDGIFIGDLFSLGARSVLHLTSGTNGVTTKAYIKSLYADFADQAIWVDGTGTDAQVDSLTSQGNDQTASGTLLPGSHAVWVNTTGVSLQLGNVYSKLTQGSAIQVDGSGNRVNVANLRANTFGATPGDGTPAITVSDTGTNPANGVYVGNKEQLQGVAPLVLFNATSNGGRQRFVMMNDAGGANVNEPRGYAGAAGGPATVAAVGGDASIDLQLQAKSGTGSVRLQSNGQTVLRTDAAGGSTDDLLLRGGSGAINAIAEGGDANVDLVLTSKGTAGGARLQANGVTTLRSDNPAGGDSDLLVRPSTGAVNLLTESASAAADLLAAAKGAGGSVRLQANGLTTLRTDNPGNGDTDLLVRSGTGVLALTAESASTNANIAFNPKGAGVVTAPTPAATDNSTTVATTAYVRGQAYAPLASPAFAGGPTAPTLAASDNSTGLATTAFVRSLGYAPLASPAFSGAPTAPTAAAADSSAALATTAFVKSLAYAPLAGPSFSGTVVAAGAANNVALSGAAAGNGASVAATGSDGSVDLLLAAQGSAGSTRLRANGVTVLRADSPAPGTSDVLVRSGAGTVSFTGEDSGGTVSLSFVPKGSGSIVLGGPVTSASGTQVYTAAGGATLTGNTTSTTNLGSSGTAGSTTVLKGGEANASVQTAASGAALTVSSNVERVILLSGVTTGGFTLTMMAAPQDGQLVLLECDVSVTLSVAAASGQSMKGAPTACSATQGHQFHYRAADTAWRTDF